MRKHDFVTAFSIFSFLCVFSAGKAVALDLGPVDGVWEGQLVQMHGQGLNTHDYPPQTWRIALQGDVAHMFIVRDGKPQEVHPGTYRVARLGSNVLIYSLATGGDKDGVWIETESFLLLKKTPDVLGVNFSGAVNNVDAPLDSDISKFFSAETGEFHRVQ